MRIYFGASRHGRASRVALGGALVPLVGMAASIGRTSSWEGTDTELETVLTRWMLAPEWIVYPEDDKAPTDSAAIVTVAPFWRDMRALQDPLFH